MSYQVLGKHARNSLLFISNFTYLKESGYFDIGGYEKFLLHTWSLSVEWQFYIFYPVLLLILKKWITLNKLKIVVAIATMLFFILGLYVSLTKPESAYFMLHARAWELLLGGVVFLYPIKLSATRAFQVELAGILLIVSSFFLINDGTAWPGYMAILPTFGAFLIIAANNQKSLLSNVVFQKLGLWSYSIYLIHWPIIVLTHKLNVNNHFYYYLPVVIFLSFILYHLIERKRDYGLISVASFSLVLLMCILVKKDGVAFRAPEEFKLTASEYHHKYYGGSGISSSGKIDVYNELVSRKIIISGDSFARQYVPFLIKNKLKVYSIMNDGCLSTKNYYQTYNKDFNQMCSNRYDNFIKTINNNPDAKFIIYAQSWRNFKNATSKQSGQKIAALHFEKIKKDIINLSHELNANQKLIIIGNPIGTHFNMYECLAKNSINFITFIEPQKCTQTEKLRSLSFNEELKLLARKNEKIYFFDPNDALCNEIECLNLTTDGKPIYSDKSHLSKHGAQLVGKRLINFMDEIDKINSVN